MSKQYGLIIPNKNRGHQVQELVAKPSIFDDDSDSETENAKPTGITKTIKKQHIINQEKAVEEDPTVFQYDEIYDEMDKKRKESKLARTDLDKKPKYINRLLATAERRKRENERRIERQVQKERDEEGEQFKDKESFVTSAYKKKLEELKQLEEQEKREEYLESIGDVRKQGNLDGFYRHLYDQKVCYEDKIEEETKIKSEPSEKNDDNDKESRKRKISEDKNPDKKRSYRQRQDSNQSDNESTNEEETVKKEHLPSNLDADSDFSIDSSDSEDDENSSKKIKEEEQPTNKAEKTEQNISNTNLPTETLTTKENVVDKEDVKENKENTDENLEKAEEIIKPKIDIWKKRTVGEVFDEALKRYYERKALREAGN